MRAFSPHGQLIVGTLETIQARADTAADSFVRQPDGRVGYDHAGNTEVFWDTQETVRTTRGVVFLDEFGGEWSAEDLRVVETEDETIQPVDSLK